MVVIKKQLSVIIENKPGVLTLICDSLASHGVNIEGFSAYGEREHGIVRLVTSDAERAVQVLTDNGLLVTQTDILGVKLANRPAGLARLARQLAQHRINIEYAYGSAASAGRMALIYLRVANVERACSILASKPAAKTRAARAKTKARSKSADGRRKPAKKRLPVRSRARR